VEPLKSGADARSRTDSSSFAVPSTVRVRRFLDLRVLLWVVAVALAAYVSFRLVAEAG
jgi:hypothetical protein